jgi:hypothetical protein
VLVAGVLEPAVLDFFVELQNWKTSTPGSSRRIRYFFMNSEYLELKLAFLDIPEFELQKLF